MTQYLLSMSSGQCQWRPSRNVSTTIINTTLLRKSPLVKWGHQRRHKLSRLLNSEISARCWQFGGRRSSKTLQIWRPHCRDLHIFQNDAGMTINLGNEIVKRSVRKGIQFSKSESILIDHEMNAILAKYSRDAVFVVNLKTLVLTQTRKLAF